MMHRNKSVDSHAFAMVPSAEIPRSAFNIERAYKTTFDAGKLIPVLCEEVLPGDTLSVNMTAFTRLATPLFPIMDNMYLDSFFFFVPNRLVWTNWVKFMGEQASPGDSISFAIPKLTSPVGGYAIGSVFDYFGLPTVGQVGAGATVTHNVLPLRAYNLIFNQWFRDENLVTPFSINLGDGPDALGNFGLQSRGKRHDYFTSCLPWPQKGAVAVSLPLGTSAPVKTGSVPGLPTGAQAAMTAINSATGVSVPAALAIGTNAIGTFGYGTTPLAGNVGGIYPGNLYADLSTATAATINQIRQAFQIQRFLERDARGGTRYIEIIFSHFGVRSPDARLQRPEYLGGGSTPIIINPVAQTSATAGAPTPLGNLAAIGTSVGNHGFSQSFTEHGYIIGIISVRADMTYQQGLRRHWKRDTRYDYYDPAFAMLGEQAVLNQEIFCDGSVTDTTVFGYQERWAEYRYSPSEITGLFRSTAAGTLDPWHLSQRFTVVPTLGSTFITEAPPVTRILATSTTNAQFLFDSFWKIRAARPMPLYSVPGLIDHF